LNENFYNFDRTKQFRNFQEVQLNKSLLHMSIMKVLLNEVHFINTVFKIFQVDSISLTSQIKFIFWGIVEKQNVTAKIINLHLTIFFGMHPCVNNEMEIKQTLPP